MTPGSMAELLFDFILVLTLLAVALSILALRQAFAAVLAFVAYGLLRAMAWVRLDRWTWRSRKPPSARA